MIWTVNPPAPRHSGLDWLVVGNAGRARVFERDSGNGAMREIADPVHPAAREKALTLAHDRPGRVHKGQASTALDPHTPVKERERQHFAHELAQMLERAAIDRRMPGLVLMVSNPFLGELKAAMGPAARAVMKASIPLDLTGLQGAELEHRVAAALSGDGVAAPLA